MDCQTTRERLSEYLDEALGERETRAVAAHLSGCTACRQRLDDLRVTKAVLRREPVPASSPVFWERIHAEIRRQPAPQPNPFSLWLVMLVGRLRPQRVLVAGAMLTAVLLAVVFFRPGTATAPPDELDEFIAQHAEHCATYPLSDGARLTFVRAEVNAAKGGE